MNVLQTIVFPTEANADRTVLFARWPKGGIHLSAPDGTLRLEENKVLNLASFFNSFSHRRWHALTHIEDLSFRIRGVGVASITIATYTRTAAAKIVAKFEGPLAREGVIIQLPKLSQITGEMLAAEISAGTSLQIESADWATSEPARRSVNLAAVITSFRREEQTQAAIEKFSKIIIPNAQMGNIHLYVIDNGRTIKFPSNSVTTVIPNPNLGGAGGFTRGLLEARKNGHSHVLFMDDDASCEPESVWRTQSLLSYVRDERMAVSGAMFYDDRPCVQYEKGAWLRTHGVAGLTWNTHHHNWDMSDLAAVASNDLSGASNYGGWWFFAFPLQFCKHLPFPFFVRGDDVDFCVVNELPVATLNGISTWCDNFGYKLTPQTEYLAARSWWALSLMHSDEASARKTLQEMLAAAARMMMRFDYASMNAVLDGLEDAAKGPDFFASNPAPIETLAKLKEGAKSEPVSEKVFDSLLPVNYQRPRLRRLISFLSIGGAILPESKIHSTIVHTRIAWEAGTWPLLRAAGAAYGVGKELSLYRRNPVELRNGIKRIWRLRNYLKKKIPELQKRFKSESFKYRNESYWASLFRSEGNIPHP